MVNIFAMYLVGVAHSIICVASETMHQIDLGKMDIRALAVQRAVGRALLGLAASLRSYHDREIETARHALLAQTVAYVAYLDTLEERDTYAAEQKRADYDAAAACLTPAIQVLVERAGHLLD
jgi:hypothetical protein